MNNQLARYGFAIVPGALDEPAIAALADALTAVGAGTAVRGRGESYAIRNLLDVPAVRALAASAAVRALVEPLLGRDAFAG